MITIDLQSRVLTPDRGVFFVRPGAGYRLHPDFESLSTIFSDLPGLDLDIERELAEQPDIFARIRRASKIRLWYQHKSGDFPSRDIDAYRSAARDQSVATLYTILRGFFERANKGDLVLVPPRRFNRNALIGEIQTDAPGYQTVSVPRLYEDE
ncbi:MAG: hypothetical protein AAFY56_19770, partial [Pseudomonadota bacterium]